MPDGRRGGVPVLLLPFLLLVLFPSRVGSGGGEQYFLVHGERAPGRHSVHWDGRNEHGEPVGSDVYLYRIQAGTFVSTKKMIVAR